MVNTTGVWLIKLASRLQEHFYPPDHTLCLRGDPDDSWMRMKEV